MPTEPDPETDRNNRRTVEDESIGMGTPEAVARMTGRPLEEIRELMADDAPNGPTWDEVCEWHASDDS